MNSFEHDRSVLHTGSPVVDLADLLGALDVALVAVTAEGQVAYANAAAARLLGVDAAEVAGRPLRSAVPAFCGETEWDLMRHTLEDGRPRSFQSWAAARDDGRRAVRALARRSANGLLLLELRDAAAVIGGRTTPPAGQSVLDGSQGAAEVRTVRELARALVTVSDATALLEMLIAAAQSLVTADGALVVQLQQENGLFVSATGTVAALRGRRVFVPGTPLDRAMTRGEPVALDDAAALVGGTEALLAGPALVAPLVAHATPLGVLVVSRAAGSTPFGAREEAAVRLVADHLALALWKAHLVEEAESASQAKSNFLATMSHELRTPLTTLIGYGELLADEIFGPMPAQQLEMVERMRSVTHALTITIDEILTYSSIEAGREIARLRDVSGAELLRTAHAMIEPVARQKGLTLGMTLERGPAPLRTDPDKVRQILLNLAGNGVKFTDQGGVHLSLSCAEGAMLFAVRDTGTGITEEDQARLFQPFTQLDGGLTRRHGGTGLGLYISQRLAALLGGHIDVESVPGNGSTFTLVLPRG